jgi:ribokinase
MTEELVGSWRRYRVMRRVVVVGSCNVDYVVVCPVLPRPGATVLGSDLRTVLGGKGANQAVAAARQGVPVRMVARVGADAGGAAALVALAAHGVDTTAVARDQRRPTGVALIAVDRTGQNLIIVAPGANGTLSARAARAAVADLTAEDLVLAQLEVPIATVAAAFRVARRAGARTVLNTAPAPPREAAAALLRLASVVIANAAEATQLAGQTVHDVATARSAARALRATGPDLVVVTLGTDGAVAVDATQELVQPAFRVNTVDTTGAGDAFCGALAAWLDRVPLAEALTRAAAAGALATTRRGALPSLPTARAVHRLVSAAAVRPHVLSPRPRA